MTVAGGVTATIVDYKEFYVAVQYPPSTIHFKTRGDQRPPVGSVSGCKDETSRRNPFYVDLWEGRRM